MYPVSNRFLEAVRKSHEIIVQGDVLYNRATIYTGLNIQRGTVVYDTRAASRARCDLTLVEPLQIPTGPGDILSPYGYEIRVWRGVRFGDGATELVPLITAPIQISSVNESMITTVRAVDRSQLIRDARLEEDFVITAGTNGATALRQLIEGGASGLIYNLPSTTYTFPSTVIPGGAQSDRWATAQKMAASLGWYLRFDGLGVVTATPETSLATTTPVFTVDEGGVLINVDVELDRASAYNRWIHSSRSSSTGAQYRGVATDTDSASPTAYDGPFGRKPTFFESEFYNSTAQCIAGAEAAKARSIGVSRSMVFSMVPNVALVEQDVVTVRRTELEVDEPHVIDALTIGLDASAVMTGRTRTRNAA
jgi:hypothetical protein